MQQPINVKPRPVAAKRLLIGNLPAHILRMDGLQYAVLHTEQYRENPVQNYALAPSAIAHQKQAFILRRDHPRNNIFIFGQMVILLESGVHGAEDCPKKLIAGRPVSPGPRPYFAMIEHALAGHLRNQLSNVVCHNIYRLVSVSVLPASRSLSM